MKRLQTPRRIALLAPLTMALMFLLLPRPALAHAVLVSSVPANQETVQVGNGNLVIRLTYNSRIVASRSSLVLVGPDGAAHPLGVDRVPEPNVLAAKTTGVVSGAYRLQWQVLASDGHITRGVVSFRAG